MGWSEETIFFKTSDIFDSFIKDCQNARESIWIEVFSLEDGKLLKSILPALVDASERGVDVRIIMDAVGSMDTNKSFLDKYSKIKLRQFRPIITNLFNINRRNHRKLFLFDQEVAYVGSSNIDDMSFYWRESAVRLKGSSVDLLVHSYYKSWQRVDLEDQTLLDRIKNKTKSLFETFNFKKMIEHQILLTDNSFDRIKAKRFWLNRIKKARKCIEITTPYFVPTLTIYAALVKAAKRGVEVTVLFPAKVNSDFPFIKNIERYYIESLLKHGVKFYEYLPQMIHAKVCLFDNQVIIGSSNWNHRSSQLDMELDVILTKKHSYKVVKDNFQADLKQSYEITLSNFPRVNFIQKIFFRLVMFLRYWF